MDLFGKGSMWNPGGFIGKAGALKSYAGSKEGSVFSGRAILQGGPKDQNMESARTFDVFGSPATAGTKMQTPARIGALAYGAWAAAPYLASYFGGEGGAAGAGKGGGGLGGLGGTGGGSAMNYLRWGQRGYNAYNMLNNMNGSPQQPQGGSPYGMAARPYPPRPMYRSGLPMQPQQRPLPGSGPFDWLKL